MDATIRRVLDRYLVDGTIDSGALEDMAASIGGRYTVHGRTSPVHVVRNAAGRTVMAGGTERGDTARQLPTKPCETCGSPPTFAYREGSPGYACGPHPPIWPTKEGVGPGHGARQPHVDLHAEGRRIFGDDILTGPGAA